jgi:hypothetical protein
LFNVADLSFTIGDIRFSSVGKLSLQSAAFTRAGYFFSRLSGIAAMSIGLRALLGWKTREVAQAVVQ